MPKFRELKGQPFGTVRALSKNSQSVMDTAVNSIRRSIGSHFRRSLISGLLLLIPVALTYVIIRFLFDLVDGFLGPWIRWVLEQFGIDWTLPGPGIIAAVVIIYLMGAFATFKVGRAAVDWARASLLRVPFVGTIYSANRQLIESFSGTSVTGFKTRCAC